MRKTLVKLLTLVLFAGGICQTVYGNENTVRVDQEAVALDKNWHDYTLKSNEYAYCPVTVKDNGRLDISVQTYLSGNPYVYLLDENYENINYKSVQGAGEASPVIVNFSYDVTAGQYYIRVESRSDQCSGRFQVKAGFTESSVEDKNKNIDFQSAVDYTAPQMTGFLSSKDTGEWYADSLPENSQNFRDYYKLDAKSDTYEIQVTGADPTSSFQCIVYDARYQEIAHQYQADPFCVDLTEETYYFCVQSDSSIAGDYILKVEAQTGEADQKEQENFETQIQEVTIKVGESHLLTDDNTEGNMKWGCTNSAVAAVAQNGTVIGLKTGSTWIAGISEEGKQTLLYKVTVE